jgi:hypothetical protein
MGALACQQRPAAQNRKTGAPEKTGQPAVCSAISNAAQKYPKNSGTESTTNVHLSNRCDQLI